MNNQLGDPIFPIQRAKGNSVSGSSLGGLLTLVAFKYGPWALDGWDFVTCLTYGRIYGGCDESQYGGVP
jgi:hypothetical protein